MFSVVVVVLKKYIDVHINMTYNSLCNVSHLVRKIYFAMDAYGTKKKTFGPLLFRKFDRFNGVNNEDAYFIIIDTYNCSLLEVSDYKMICIFSIYN